MKHYQAFIKLKTVLLLIDTNSYSTGLKRILSVIVLLLSKQQALSTSATLLLSEHGNIINLMPKLKVLTKRLKT